MLGYIEVKTMLYLNVPYEEKDEAKKLGALWNQSLKTWFIPASANLSSFKQWIEGQHIISSYYYICLSYDPCYKCGKYSPVFAFMIPPDANVESDNEDEDYLYGECNLLSDITNITYSVYDTIKSFTKNYHLDFSYTSRCSYFMNHCIYCNAKHGEFFLYHEPGGGFFINEVSNIYCVKINKPFDCYGFPGNPIDENNFSILDYGEFSKNIRK